MSLLKTIHKVFDDFCNEKQSERYALLDCIGNSTPTYEQLVSLAMLEGYLRAANNLKGNLVRKLPKEQDLNGVTRVTR